jgi:hypothetical protein
VQHGCDIAGQQLIGGNRSAQELGGRRLRRMRAQHQQDRDEDEGNRHRDRFWSPPESEAGEATARETMA